MSSVAVFFRDLATVRLLAQNVACEPATWPRHTQEGFEQEIIQVSQAIEHAAAASSSRSRRALGVSSSGVTISPMTDGGLASLRDTALKRFWTPCYGMQTEYGAASLTCLRGPSMARTAVQSCASIVEGKDFDDLVQYARWLTDIKDEITTVV